MSGQRARASSAFLQAHSMSEPTPTNSPDLLRELLAFQSVTLTPNIELIERVRELLARAGIESTLVADPQDAGRSNLYASVGPQDVPGILLSGHTDVVPVTGQPWTSPPFEATLRAVSYTHLTLPTKRIV